MNSLVERTIAAHGGMKRWNEVQSALAEEDRTSRVIALSNFDLK